MKEENAVLSAGGLLKRLEAEDLTSDNLSAETRAALLCIFISAFAGFPVILLKSYFATSAERQA